jgi:predicted  nucleic acid-binding Zn-ribbon protein
VLEFLYRLEDEINRARYEIDEKYHMGQADLVARQRLAAAMEQLKGATEPPPIPAEKTTMPTIAEQLKAARAKLAEARDGATNAIAQSDDASRVVLGEVNKVLKEAEDLRAEVAELTNGGPA